MRFLHKQELDISIVMPCLNEEKTVGSCVRDAFRFISENDLRGEVIVVDNGCGDASPHMAAKCGAEVVQENRRGYGRALRTGISQSRGKVIIICDCDMTYDLRNLGNFYFPLRAGRFDVMIGDRFSGGIERGAMPLLHRIGVPVLSALGRFAFGVNVRDFHCGLRSFTRNSAQKMHLRTTGMEFATEFISEAALCSLKIGQCPTILKKSTAGRCSKLRTFRDGSRHLKFIMKRFKNDIIQKIFITSAII